MSSGRLSCSVTEQSKSCMQIEYHYFGPDSPVDPPRMLAVLQGLTARYLRVFNVEPNYWWSNQGHDFIEFAYLQVGAPPLRRARVLLAGCDLRWTGMDAQPDPSC